MLQVLDLLIEKHQIKQNITILIFLYMNFVSAHIFLAPFESAINVEFILRVVAACFSMMGRVSVVSILVIICRLGHKFVQLTVIPISISLLVGVFRVVSLQLVELTGFHVVLPLGEDVGPHLEFDYFQVAEHYALF